MVVTQVTGLDGEETTVEIAIGDQEAGGIEPAAVGIAGHGDGMRDGREAQPLDPTRVKMAITEQEGLGFRT